MYTKRVAILGSGVAGLVTVKTLTKQGIECVLFEKNDLLGGVWADGYSGFGVQVPKELYEFPDWPLPKDIADFTPGPVFQKYLEDYVDYFNLRTYIRFNTCVTRIEPRGTGDQGWTVTINTAGIIKQDFFDFVVIATGLYSNIPKVPSFPNEHEFEGQILHNSEIKSRAMLADKNIAIVGYGKSAMDIVQEAATVANDLHMIFRKPHWPVPRKLAGLVPAKWGALSRMTKAFMPLYQYPTGIEQWIDRYGKPLKRLFWRSLEVLIRIQFQLDRKIEKGENLIPSVSFEVDTCGEGTSMANPDFFPLVHNRRVLMHRTEISHFSSNGITLKNGSELNVDCVVLATGWETNYSFLPLKVRAELGSEDDGFYLYRHILHPNTPNLAFIGRVNAFTNILTYSLQARWLAEYLDGRVMLPEKEKMLREIEAMKDWKRSWMHFSPGRSSRIFLHAQHYHDELLKDFGANPFRKRGLLAPIKELFSPYLPADYQDIIAGDIERDK